MAKTPGLSQALKAVNTLKRQMNKESSADYAVTTSANAAGQANLRSQTRALTRDLLASQAKSSAALARYAKAARAGEAKVGRAQATQSSRYGSALAGSAAAQFSPAQAVAAGTVSQTQGAARINSGKTAETVAGIAQAGVQAGNASAHYALAQALQARNIVDAQTIAGLTGDLYKQAIAYNQQWELWKRQQDYAQKQAEKAQNKQFAQGVGALGDAASSAGNYLTGYLHQENPQMSVQSIMDSWAQSRGYADYASLPRDANGAIADPSLSQQATILQSSASQVIAHPTAAIQDSINSTLQSLYGALPAWDKYGPILQQSVETGVIGDISAQGIQANIAALYADTSTASAASQQAGQSYLGTPTYYTPPTNFGTTPGYSPTAPGAL